MMRILNHMGLKMRGGVQPGEKIEVIMNEGNERQKNGIDQRRNPKKGQIKDRKREIFENMAFKKSERNVKDKKVKIQMMI